MIICTLSILVGVAFPVILTTIKRNEDKKANEIPECECKRSEVVYVNSLVEIHQCWNG